MATTGDSTAAWRDRVVAQRRVLLSASDIDKSFGGIAALRHAHLELEEGEVHALMGENGAGKSTLMKIVAGVIAADAGEIRLDDRPVRFASVREAQAAGIAIIHQELNLIPELSVAENIYLGREPRRGGLIIDGRACRVGARQLLARLGIELDPDARVSSLRVGEQQLVEIAKALLVSARILIMDEPTSALSPAECERLFRIIGELSAQGVSIVYISHRLGEVMRLADRVTVFRDGRHMLTRPIGELTEDRIIAAMVGRELLAAAPETDRQTGPVLLSVRGLGLAKPFGNAWRDVVQDVNFDLASGEILGIGGLLGSGRTEILEVLFAATRGRASGSIELAGQPIVLRSPRDARRHGLALVTEDRKAEGLHLAASIRDNISLPLVGRLAQVGIRSFAAESDLATRAVRDLAIRCSDIAQTARTLSGGNQQKVVIAKWLATRPRILLLDEPTRGIDVGAKREIYSLIFRLAAEGYGIVVVSSELPELLHLSDRILVMREGRQAGILTRAEATEEKVMRLAAPHRAPISGEAA